MIIWRKIELFFFHVLIVGKLESREFLIFEEQLCVLEELGNDLSG